MCIHVYTPFAVGVHLLINGTGSLCVGHRIILSQKWNMYTCRATCIHVLYTIIVHSTVGAMCITQSVLLSSEQSSVYKQITCVCSLIDAYGVPTVMLV